MKKSLFIACLILLSGCATTEYNDNTVCPSGEVLVIGGPTPRCAVQQQYNDVFNPQFYQSKQGR